MAQAGADIIDVGGESTRPGSLPVSTEEEIARTVPLVRRVKSELDVAVSIDTSKPEVMQAAVGAGADMINDVFALQQPGALEMAARLHVPVCLMHMRGAPRTMQAAPQYQDVVSEVSSFLLSRVSACQAAGIPGDAIVLDPGFGFGKTFLHNLELFRAIPVLCQLGFPLLVGMSRKSMLGEITGKKVHERMPASIAAALLAVQLGAAIVRVHDVGETVDALKTAAALAA
jgi:dihydropteroate synthase